MVKGETEMHTGMVVGCQEQKNLTVTCLLQYMIKDCEEKFEGRGKEINFSGNKAWPGLIGGKSALRKPWDHA